MKAAQAQEILGIKPETIADQDVDITRLVESEEFDRKTPKGAPDYRHRAIDRLIDARVGFSSSCNITHELAQRLLKVTCPHCKSNAPWHGGGGNMDTTTITFRCEKKDCQTEIHLNVSNHGIGVDPQTTAKPQENRETIIDELLSNFTRIQVDGLDYVNVTTEKAESFWDEDTRAEQNMLVEAATVIVRLETAGDDPEELYFREIDLYTAKVKEDGSLLAFDTSGTLKHLHLFQENQASFPPQP